MVKRNANGRRGVERGGNIKFTRSECAKQARRLKAKNENKENAWANAPRRIKQMIEKTYEIEKKKLLKDPKSSERTLQTMSWWTIWEVDFFHAYGTYLPSIRVFSYGCHASFTLVFIFDSKKLEFVGEWNGQICV